jgi:hypothetical protein
MIPADTLRKMVRRCRQEYDDHIRRRDSRGSGSNRENPATGYDQRIPAIFPTEAARTLSLENTQSNLSD